MPPKNILGKGLGAILPDLLDELNERPSFVHCSVEELVPNRFQPRKEFNDEEHRNLVESIRNNGLLQPVIVRPREDGYEIIAGERRWRAAREAGCTEIPILIRDAEDVEVAELSLIENLQRSALNALEEAEALRLDDRERRFLSKRAGKTPAPTGWVAPGRQECRRRKSPPEGQGDEGQSSGDQMIGKSPEGL